MHRRHARTSSLVCALVCACAFVLGDGIRDVIAFDARRVGTGTTIDDVATSRVETRARVENVRVSADGDVARFVVREEMDANGTHARAYAFELTREDAPRTIPNVVTYLENEERVVMDRARVIELFSCTYAGTVVDDDGRTTRARATLCDGHVIANADVYGETVEFSGMIDVDTQTRGRGLAQRVRAREMEGMKLTGRRVAKDGGGYNMMDDALMPPKELLTIVAPGDEKLGHERRLLATSTRYIEVVFYVGKELRNEAGSDAAMTTKLNSVVSFWNDIFANTRSMNPSGSVIIKEIIMTTSLNAWGNRPATINLWLERAGTKVPAKISPSTQYDVVAVVNNYGDWSYTIGLAWVNTVCETFNNPYYRFSVNSGSFTYSATYWASLVGHEVGHNLGFNHDGDKPGCVDAGIMGWQLGLGDSRYSEGTGCDADIWNSGQYIDPDSGEVYDIDYSCLSAANTEVVPVGSPPPPPTSPPPPSPPPPSPPPSPPPPSPPPPSSPPRSPPLSPPPPKSPPPSGAAGGSPPGSRTVTYVTSKVYLSGISASEFDVPNVNRFHTAIVSYLGLQSRSESVSIVSIVSSVAQRKRRMLLAPPSTTMVNIKVTLEDASEESHITTALQSSVSLTQAVQLQLPAVVSAAAMETSSVTVTINSSPVASSDEMPNYHALMAITTVFVLVAMVS